jgi:hypothetical protein
MATDDEGVAKANKKRSMSDAAKKSSEFIKENKNEELKGGWFDTQEEYD